MGISMRTLWLAAVLDFRAKTEELHLTMLGESNIVSTIGAATLEGKNLTRNTGQGKSGGEREIRTLDTLSSMHP